MKNGREETENWGLENGPSIKKICLLSLWLPKLSYDWVWINIPNMDEFLFENSQGFAWL